MGSATTKLEQLQGPQAMPERSFLGKLFGGEGRDNAALEVNQLAARRMQLGNLDYEAKDERATALNSLINGISADDKGNIKIPFVPTWIPNLLKDNGLSDDALVDNKHDQDLQQIKVKTMLNDMITQDPTLSAYPPVDIINAFNDLAELMPGLSSSPLLMRNAIARVVQQQGHIDASEIKEFLAAEEKNRATKTLPPVASR